MASGISVGAVDQRTSHLAPVAKPAEPLFLATSVEWIMDASVPVEIRVLCQMIMAKALGEAKIEGRSFTDFGREPVTTVITRDWIIDMTGWAKNKAEAIRTDAIAKGFLAVTGGSSRTGYQYTVSVALRTYRSNADMPPAKSLCLVDRQPPKSSKPSKQLPLSTDLGASVPLPDTRKWSRADRDFYARSSGAIRTVYARLSGANRKLFARLSAANQELYARSPDANPEFLARLSGEDDELSARRSGAKLGLVNVRARSQELGQKPYQNLLADILTPEIRSRLLLLARKKEHDTEPDSRTFVNALGRIVTALDEICEHDIGRTRDLFLRIIEDERVTSHANPIAQLIIGVCNTPRFLLTRTAAPKHAAAHDRSYESLAEPLREMLLERIRDGRLTPQWCRERDIVESAQRTAIAVVAGERSVAGSAPDRVCEPPAEGCAKSDGKPEVSVEPTEGDDLDGRARSAITTMTEAERAALRDRATHEVPPFLKRGSAAIYERCIAAAEHRLVLQTIREASG